MIISRTPYRISLFGGGTDYPQWYTQHGGAVLGMTIDKYSYISVRYLPPVFDHKYRIIYAKNEMVEDIRDIQHPAVRAVLSEMQFTEGLDIHYNGDLPARSGLGSSSTFTVGLLHALHALRGQMISKQQLAEEAIRIEQEVIVENVGSQDQIWAAYGGLNRIDFHQDGRFSVQPVTISRVRERELLDHVMLFFTGISRYASDIAKHKIENLSKRERQLHEMRSIVDQAQNILTSASPMAEMGELLHTSWQLKRELAAPVSSDTIDDIYTAGREAGAIGGKLLGAGGGGFILFLVPPEKQDQVRQRLSTLIEVKVDIDTSGSNIMVYLP